MIRGYVNRMSRWYNDQHGDRPVYLFLAFCLVFLVSLWLGIRFIRFDTKVYTISIPRHIGKPSGPEFTDSLTLKKH
jgi:hypothetical protein